MCLCYVRIVCNFSLARREIIALLNPIHAGLFRGSLMLGWGKGADTAFLCNFLNCCSIDMELTTSVSQILISAFLLMTLLNLLKWVKISLNLRKNICIIAFFMSHVRDKK